MRKRSQKRKSEVKNTKYQEKKIWTQRTLFFLLFCLFFLLGVVIYQNEKGGNYFVEGKEDSFSSLVETKRSTPLYQKANGVYQAVGTVGEKVTIPLEESYVHEERYFPIRDTEYYVDSHAVRNSFVLPSTLDSFVITKQITTQPTILYQNEEVAFAMEDSHTFDVLWEKDGVYEVAYLGNLYEVREFATVVEKETEPLLTQLPVFRFSSDLSSSKRKEILSYFQELGYQSINKHQFEIWVHQEGALPQKSLFLIGDDSSILEDSSFYLEEEVDLSQFPFGDRPVRPLDESYSAYELTNTTSLERLRDMLEGRKEIPEGEEAEEIAVLNYHFFYDPRTETCNESICLPLDNFREQLDYLRDQGYHTLTMQEFYDWKEGNIRLPKKSLLITVDDGAAGTSTYLPQLLNEYQMHASLFLITGWWERSNYETSDYLEIYSHGDELHHDSFCNDQGCGYKAQLLSKEELVADLNTSFSKLSSRLAFCYPFYRTSPALEEALRETGVSLAFVGGNRKVKRTDSNYYLPRYVVYKSTSLSSFIQMIS